MNSIIRSFWFGSSLSNLERLSLASYLSNGHAFELFTYDKTINTPPGVILRDANEILPRTALFLDSKNSYASFADWFRFRMLYNEGGWWTDLDSVCLRSLDIAEDYCFSSEGSVSQPMVNCGNIKAPRMAEFLEECLSEIEKLVASKDFTWGKYGISLLGSVLRNYDYKEFVRPPMYFCPIHYSQVSDIVSPTIPSIPKECYSIHLWNQMWTTRGWDKNGNFPNTCLFERLKVRYLTNTLSINF